MALEVPFFVVITKIDSTSQERLNKTLEAVEATLKVREFTLYLNQGGRGHWTVNHTGTFNFIKCLLFVGSKTLNF